MKKYNSRPNSIVLSINFEKDVAKKIREHADKMGVSMSSVVNTAIKAEMRKPLERLVRVFSKCGEPDVLDMTMRQVLERLK